MNEAATTWVIALKYGGYSQGTGSLHEAIKDGPDLFCCLGVACKLFIEEHGEESLLVEDAYEKDFTAYEGSDVELPKQVMDWLGIADYLGGYGERDEDGDYPHGLASLNDKKQSFMDIGRVIESEPKGLFIES